MRVLIGTEMHSFSFSAEAIWKILEKFGCRVISYDRENKKFEEVEKFEDIHIGWRDFPRLIYYGVPNAISLEDFSLFDEDSRYYYHFSYSDLPARLFAFPEGLDKGYFDTDSKEVRTHPILLKVFDEIGERFGMYGEPIEAVKIPFKTYDGWYIAKGDEFGDEWIAENHRTWGI